jgi:ABC-type lipoprotein export system ATPase subunit
MQRVAICRALIGEPRLILADEPTGSLDDKNVQIVMDLLLELVRERGATLLLVTHSAELASRADEIWRLQSGELERA